MLSLVSAVESRAKDALDDPALNTRPTLDALARLAVREQDTGLSLMAGTRLQTLSPHASRQRRVRALRLLLARSRALRAALSEALPPPRADAPALARSVLSANEFKVVPHNHNWLDSVQEWIDKILSQLGSKLGLRPSTGSRNLLMVVLLSIVFGLLTWVTLITARRLRPDAEWQDTPGIVPGEGAAEPAVALAQARDLARRGLYREAVARLYVAALLHLDALGRLRLDTNRTNWENLRGLDRALPADLRQGMGEATLLFDRLWYGVADCGRDSYETAEALLGPVWTATPAPTPVQGQSAARGRRS